MVGVSACPRFGMSATRREAKQEKIGIRSIIKIIQVSLSEEHRPRFPSRALASNWLLHLVLQDGCLVRALQHGGSPALPVKPSQWSATEYFRPSHCTLPKPSAWTNTFT